MVVPSLLADVRVVEVADAARETVLAEAAEIAVLADAEAQASGPRDATSPPGDDPTARGSPSSRTREHGAPPDAGGPVPTAAMPRRTRCPDAGGDPVEEVRS